MRGAFRKNYLAVLNQINDCATLYSSSEFLRGREAWFLATAFHAGDGGLLCFHLSRHLLLREAGSHARLNQLSGKFVFWT